jgi:hypothetical protein
MRSFSAPLDGTAVSNMQQTLTIAAIVAGIFFTSGHVP